MTKTPAWRRYLRFWRADVAADVEDELRFHFEMRVDEYVARGMTEEDARRAVAARLGDVDGARAECIALGQVRERRARNAGVFDGLRADVQFALRGLARSRAWTTVALLTIALGVGATTTVFSVADALLVRPLAYRDASRVYVVGGEIRVDSDSVLAAVRAWREHARTIEDLSAFSVSDAPFGRGAEAPAVRAGVVDAEFLPFAGARPLIGRNFTTEELAPEGPGAMMLSEGFWRRQYGASPDVLGTVVEVEGRARTIVGVVPASVGLPILDVGRSDIWIPLGEHRNDMAGVVVRLEPGVSREAAAQELEVIVRRLGLLSPPPGLELSIALVRPQDELELRSALTMLTGAVALLLLVACTNVAHLLLARGAARQRELAVRHALGAERSRLLRQLVTESVVLAAFGGALAVVVGWAGLRALEAIRPENLTALTRASEGRGVLSIASVLAVGAGLVIGLLAALRSAHRNLGPALRMGASSPTLAGRRLRSSLVVGEVALSATLLVGALLLIHTVFDLQRTKLGFDARGVYSVTFPLSETEVRQGPALAAQLREEASRLPGVEGVTEERRGTFVATVSKLETPDGPAPGGGADRMDVRIVAPDYFSVMRIPLVAGRMFDERWRARYEVIVSRSFARRLWPDGNVLGRRFREATPPGMPAFPWFTVVGVAPDIVWHSLFDGTSKPAIYRPLDAEAYGLGFAEDFELTLLVRERGDEALGLLRQFAASARPNRPPPTIENVRERIDQSLAQPRFIMLILVAFASVGVVMAAIGLFGVISYSVGQRTREIGVRLAFGATRGDIARLVIGDGARLALFGTALGLLGSVATTRLIQNVLYGVARLDPFSFGVGAALMLIVSIAACVAPMLRAASLDPVVALRVD